MKRALFVAAAMALTAVPAYAFDVKVTDYIVDGTGKPMQDCDHIDRERNPQAPFCDLYVNMTVGRLLAGLVDWPDKDLKPSDLAERGWLAQRLRKAVTYPYPDKGVVDLQGHDVDLLNDLLLKAAQTPGGLLPSQYLQIKSLLTPPSPNK